MEINNLSDFRKSLGMSQKAFAEFVGIGKNTVAAYEQGWRTPSFRIMEKIARATKEPMEKILAIVGKEWTRQHAGTDPLPEHT